MRAKSIKNKARVNVEMSPAELKAMLKKTVAELAAVREHASKLEEEVSVWRKGMQVESTDWVASLQSAGPTKEGGAMGSRRGMSGVVSPPIPSTPSRIGTPGGGPLSSLLSPFQSDSRPETPTVYSLPVDEKEEFLRRENELSDQLADKVSCNKRLL
jgi:kinesin family protein 5